MSSVKLELTENQLKALIKYTGKIKIASCDFLDIADLATSRKCLQVALERLEFEE